MSAKKSKPKPQQWSDKIRKFLRSYGILVLGVLLLLSGLSLKERRARALSFYGVVGEIQEVSNPPKKIEIPKVGIDLAVEPGSINDDIWSISETGATHLITSSSPGENGNVVIYAHNKTNLFGPIRWLSIGEEVRVTNADGSIFRYTITEVHTVDPDAIEYVLPKDEETLTLYTCTGFADKDRYIVVAKPVSEQ